MDPSELPAVKSELNQLRARLDSLEAHQQGQISQFRGEIETLSLLIESTIASELARNFASFSPETAVPCEEPAPLPKLPPPPPPRPDAFEAARRFQEARMKLVPPVPAEDPQPEVAAVPEGEGSFEMRLGRVWLGRIGIAILVTGLVLLGNFAYKNWIHDLPAAVRLLFLSIGAGALTGAGWFVRKKESTALFGEVILAGGLAFAYWCTFAAHHVPRLRVIESPVAGALLVLGAAGVITVLSLAWRSRIIGVMGLLLASYATMLQPLGWLSSVSNLALAVAGIVITLRTGWAGPGIVALAGSYLSFFWWQIVARHAPVDASGLWFLPPVWAVFAGSVLFRPNEQLALSRRGRAFLASANNLAFFGLFSGLWLKVHGAADYWMVTAVYGGALVGLGLSRPARAALGGAFLTQGLAAITLALVLKLDGYQLALGLAIQSVLLAGAFSRFGGKPEMIFSIGTAIGAALLCSTNPLLATAPLWSNALVGVFLMATGVLFRKGCDLADVTGEQRTVARAFAVLQAGLGAAVLMFDYCARLPEFWRGPSSALIGLALLGGCLRFDRAKRLPELAALSVIFGGFSVLRPLGLSFADSAWSPAIVAGVSVLVHWLWAHPGRKGYTDDLKALAEAGSSCSMLMVAAATAVALLHAGWNRESEMLGLGLAAVGLAALGRYIIAAPRLAVAGVLLMPVIAVVQQDDGELLQWSYFVPLFASLGVFAASVLPKPGEESIDLRVSAGLSRFFASWGWLTLCRHLFPEMWGEAMALTALALGIPALLKNWRSLRAETVAFFAIGFSWFFAKTVEMPWHVMRPASAPVGWAVVVSSLVLAFLMNPSSRDERTRRDSFMLFAYGVLSVWATHLAVWHFAWKPVVILWAALGFLAVSVGLWRRLAVLRHSGFLILTLAVLKLFLVDVWDFGAFMRVVAFIALGAVLIVLGFFYNRFAGLIKKLFETERYQ